MSLFLMSSHNLSCDLSQKPLTSAAQWGQKITYSLQTPFMYSSTCFPFLLTALPAPPDATIFLAEKVDHIKNPRVPSYLHLEIHQPAIKLYLLFIYRTAERRTLIHEIQMKAGHVGHRKKPASNIWQEEVWYCNYILLRTDLRWYRFLSHVDSNLQRQSLLYLVEVIQESLCWFKPEAKSRQSYFLEMGHFLGWNVLIDFGPDAL